VSHTSDNPEQWIYKKKVKIIGIAGGQHLDSSEQNQ